jgi:hypothetical protein
MHEKGLTIGQIASRVRCVARNPGTVAENVRHYSKLGFFGALLVRDVEGTGTSRYYHPDAIYEAAILVALAAPGLHPGQAPPWFAEMVGIARHAVRKWKSARRRGETPPLYAVSTFDPQLGGLGATEIRDKRPVEEHAITITVDLGLLWRTVEEAEESE